MVPVRFQELKYYLTQKSIDEDLWIEPLLSQEIAKDSDPIWQSNIFPHDLVPSSFDAGNPGGYLPSRSFIRFLGIEPSFSLYLDKISVPSCPKCSAPTQPKHREQIRQELKSYLNGTFLFGICFEEIQFSGLTLETVLSMFGIRSVAINGTRFVGESLRPYLQNEVGSLTELVLILDSTSAPISDIDIERIYGLSNQHKELGGKLLYAFSRSTNERLDFFPLEAQFLCPNGHGQIHSNLKSGKLVGVQPINTVLSSNVASILLLLVDKVEEASQLIGAFKVLSVAGFSGYKLSDDIAVFSKGEMLRLYVARFLMRPVGDWSLDCSSVSSFLAQDELQHLRNEIATKFPDHDSKIKWGEKTQGLRDFVKKKALSLSSGKNFEVGPYTTGILKNICLTLPTTGIVTIVGWSGSGKSTLLQAMATDKSLRNFFKSVRRFQIPIQINPDTTVLSALGLSTVTGKSLSETFEARSLGITPKEILAESDRSSSLRLNGHTYSEILSATIIEAEQIYAGMPQGKEVLELAARLGFGQIALGEKLESLSFSQQLGLYLIEFISSFKRGPGLVLLDSPFTGIEFDEQGGYIKLIQEIAAAGYTVVVADNSVQFRNISESVVELTTRVSDSGIRTASIN